MHGTDARRSKVAKVSTVPHLSKISAGLLVGLVDGLIRRLLHPQGVKDGADIDVHQTGHQSVHRLVLASIALCHNDLHMQGVLRNPSHGRESNTHA